MRFRVIVPILAVLLVLGISLGLTGGAGAQQKTLKIGM